MHVVVARRSIAQAAAQKTNGPCNAAEEVVGIQSGMWLALGLSAYSDEENAYQNAAEKKTHSTHTSAFGRPYISSPYVKRGEVEMTFLSMRMLKIHW